MFNSPLGPVRLGRRPDVVDGDLQAWDGADNLLLHAFEAARTAARIDRPRVLVVGDCFGSLVVPLVLSRGCDVTLWSDSAVSRLACNDNLRRNGFDDPSPYVFVPSVSDGGWPSRPSRASAATETTRSSFDIVLWRLPATRARLAFQMTALARTMRGAVIVAGGMDKYLPVSTLTDLRRLGDTTRRRGERKAHLFDVRIESNSWAPEYAFAHESGEDARTFGEEFGLRLVPNEAVFGGSTIDAGTRVLATAIIAACNRAVLPLSGRGNSAIAIADLGCGSGVLGLLAALQFYGATGRSSKVAFFDESYAAVASSRINVASNKALLGEGFEASFSVDDALSSYDGPGFDVIVCNPPFHQRGATSDAVAWTMMRHARHHLRSGGQIWLVGNRHLGYHVKLQRLFGNVRQLASHPKFVALSSTKR